MNMTIRPPIFVSAVTQEMRSARKLVVTTLQFLGYEPVWQDVFGTEEGDLRAMLRKQIDECKGVVQLVGQCYGAEPSIADEQFGRVSYTQYEALYARQKGKKVWYLLLDSHFPSDPHAVEPEVLQRLQSDYRQRVQTDLHMFHALSTHEALEVGVLKMKKELAELRLGVKRWAAGITFLLVLISALLVWMLVAVTAPQGPGKLTEQQANAAFIAKNYAAAFDAYIKLSALAPNTINYHRRIEESARLGHLEKPFLEHYLLCVLQDPRNAIFYNYLGNAYLLIDPKDQEGKGRESYETALRLDPQLTLPMANLGIVNFRAGKTDEAEELFKRYLGMQPEDAQAWVNLGLLYLSKIKGNGTNSVAVASAEKSLLRAIQIDPSSYSAYKALGRLRLATNRRKEALDAYQRSLALNGSQNDIRKILESELSPTESPTDDFVTRGVKTNGVSRPDGK
jgi:tetratricopeptide (TPR) repeat protein